MALRLPTGADSLSVDLEYHATTNEHPGTPTTVGVGKIGRVQGIRLMQVTSASGKYSRAVLLINAVEYLAVEADSTYPTLDSHADSNLYTIAEYFFTPESCPILQPGDTVNVSLRTANVSSVTAVHARVLAYQYTP